MASRLLTALALSGLSLLGACTFIEKDIDTGFKREARALLESATDLVVDDVLAALGPPHQLVALPDGYAFLYQKFDVRERQLGIGFDAPVLRWLKFSLADADSFSQSFIARFDWQDRLTAASVVRNKEELGEAGSIMFALNYRSQVDSSTLDSDVWGPGQWGKFMLQAPNVLLNSQSNPDTGQAALDQRGTPANVGQRTMEHRRF